MKISKMRGLGYGAAIFAVTLIATTLLLGKSQKVVAAASAPPAGIKNVVLVHGAFADGSGWEAVEKILEKDGYTVSVAQPPETSYADDVKYTRAAIDAMGGPVVLVGHSYGGAIISEAGNDPNVRHSSTSPHLRSMKVRAVPRSKRLCRKPPRHSRRITTVTGGSSRTISRPTSRRIFLPPSHITWLYRRCRSPLTRLPIRSRVPPGRPSRRRT
jgi:hypothetical protein